MIKDYIYSIFNNVKVSARNLSVKLEAIRENQDQILAIRDKGSKLFDENQELGKSINATFDSIDKYKAADISSIDDIGGLKKLVKDLKATQTLAADAIKKAQKHKSEIEKLAKEAEKTVEKIDKDETEKLNEALDRFAEAQAKQNEDMDASNSVTTTLDELNINTARIIEEAKAKIKELELEEKDEAADAQADTNPQDAVKGCKDAKVCKVTRIEIKDKANRSLVYDVPTPPPPPKDEDKDAANKESEKKAAEKEEEEETPSNPKTLYVIVGDKTNKEGEPKDYKEHITITADGTCKTNTACPKISIDGTDISEKKVSSISQLEIKPQKIITKNSWGDFLRKILVPDMNELTTKKPVIYKVKAHQCDVTDKVADLRVIAVPPVGWDGKAKVNFKLKEEAEREKIAEENKNKGFKDAEALGEWDISGEMNAYIDDNSYNFKPPEEFLTTLQKCMNKITPMFSEIEGQYAKVTVGWPNIEFGGKVDLIEHPSSHLLNYSGEITLKAAPLLQINCDVDIKAILLRILGQYEIFSEFMMEILVKVEKGVGNKDLEFKGGIELLLKTEADIKGDLRWHRTATDGAWQVDSAKSTIGGSLGIELYGAVHIEGRAFCVKGAAGASISGRSADGKDKSRFGVQWAALEGAKNPALQRGFYFNGLAIYYSAYAELGTDDTQAGKAMAALVSLFKKKKRNRGDKETKDTGEKSANNKVKAGSKELKSLCTLMEEWKSTNETAELGKDEL